MAFVYVKDNEGFVIKKKKSEICADEIIITKEEFEEISGDKYCREKFGHGGKRAGAGRKKAAPDNVLKFQVRVSVKEKEFLHYARLHNLNYDELMQG